MTRTHTRAPSQGGTRTAHAGGSLRLRFACALVACALIAPSVSAPALVSTHITMDGVFDDWAPVFDDPGNAIADPTGDQSDSNVDLTLAAVTYDTNDVFVYTRRAAATGGSASPTIYAWIDRGGDGRMHTGDMVVVFGLAGGNTFQSATLYSYVAAAGAAGDPMPGDAGWPVGTWDTPVAPLPPSPTGGAGEPSGVQFEGRVSWAALNLPYGSAITVQCGSKLGSKSDSVGVASMVRRTVTVEPNRYRGAAPSSTVTYEHTITNTGNILATYTLAAASSRGWATGVTVGGIAASQITLAAGETTTAVVSVTVPSNAADGVKDITTLTAADTTGLATGSATDATTVGSVLVVPDQSGSMAPGSVATYRNTITNTTSEQRTLDLTVSSSRSWPVKVVSTGGADITQLTLGPGASTDVYVKVTVPPGTAFGLVDVTTLAARDSAAPSIRGSGRDTTTCAPRLSATPDNADLAGPGTTVTYRHTITNATEDTRSVSVEASSSRTWTTRIYDADGTSVVSTITLDPQGGSRTVFVRVTVPAGEPAGSTCETTLTATSGTDADTARDVTTVSRLVTYSNPGYSIAETDFMLGDTVYVRGMGLGSGDQVRVRWIRPDDTQAAISGTLKADTSGVVSASYAVPVAEATGTWKVALLDSGGTEITRTTFRVAYRAHIQGVTVTGGDSVNSTITVQATLANDGAVALSGTVEHLIWWDSDGNGAFGAGDSFVDASGAVQPYSAGAITHTASVTVPAGSVLTESAWGVTNRNLAYSGTYRVTTVWTATSGTVIGRHDTQFYAVPGTPWLQLTVSENAIDFGTIDPGVPYSHSGVGVQVEANVAFDLIKSRGGAFAELGLDSSLSDQINTPGGTSDYTDVVSVEAPWNTVPGAYSAVLTYTVVVH